MSQVIPNAIRVRRHPERAQYDAAAVDAVLRTSWLAHVGFVADGKPVVIPMLYAWIDGALWLHGAVASRLLVDLARGVDACVTVTHVDGLVLARSHFNHSVNYRSAVLFGVAVDVVDPHTKAQALAAFVDQILPGRAAESRPADATELAATRLLRFELQQASVKVRAGGAKDQTADLDLPYWAGVLPMRPVYGEPLPDRSDQPLPASVRAALQHAQD